MSVPPDSEGPQDPENRESARPLEEQLRHLQRQNEQLRLLLDGLRRSRIYRAMTALGRWRTFDRRLANLVDVQHDGPASSQPNVRWTIPETAPEAASSRTIGVDLTALLPGALNGGAKIGALEVVAAMIRHFEDRDFVVLKSPDFVEPFGFESAPNLRIRDIGLEPDALTRFVNDLPIGSLFCPMTTPPWRDARVPLVCQINDIQHETYPQFFSGHELETRRELVSRSIRWSERIVTSAEYVRASLESTLGVAPGKIRVEPWRLASRFGNSRAPACEQNRLLEKLGVGLLRYFFYPANFWPHKNHRLLLSAFARFSHEHPELDYRLVLTGADHPAPGPVLEWARQVGIGDRVHFLGFVGDAEMAALFSSARALLFPSLYEGFGLPVLEAMAQGCPVLCSNSTALPEVVGDAALMVDPRNLDQLYGGLRKLALDETLTRDLRDRGLRRAAQFSRIEQQAAGIVEVLDEATASPNGDRAMITGRWPDGWTGDRLFLFHGLQDEARLLFTNPSPEAVSVIGPRQQRLLVPPRQQVELCCALPGTPGVADFNISSSRKSQEDPRKLGLLLPAARLLGPDPINLIENF